VRFIDNTDPDGIDRALADAGLLGETLTVVISKSRRDQGDPQRDARGAGRAYERAGLRFGAHAVAVTGEGSELDRVAVQGEWIARFPMWDWVGGRTSSSARWACSLRRCRASTSTRCSRARGRWTQATRARPPAQPAAALALAWHRDGRRARRPDMVVLPYKDRLSCSRGTSSSS
jgi:glucose-6-phosphate isomerase